MNCNPEAFDLECELLNTQFHKNKRCDKVKCHHYIISHDPRDITDHDRRAVGMEYAKIDFPGHQALICTHTDASNNSGNTKNKRNPIDTNHPYKKISLDLFIQAKADF